MEDRKGQIAGLNRRDEKLGAPISQHFAPLRLSTAPLHHHADTSSRQDAVTPVAELHVRLSLRSADVTGQGRDK